MEYEQIVDGLEAQADKSAFFYFLAIGDKETAARMIRTKLEDNFVKGCDDTGIWSGSAPR